MTQFHKMKQTEKEKFQKTKVISRNKKEMLKYRNNIRKLAKLDIMGHQ